MNLKTCKLEGMLFSSLSDGFVHPDVRYERLTPQVLRTKILNKLISKMPDGSYYYQSLNAQDVVDYIEMIQDDGSVGINQNNLYTFAKNLAMLFNDYMDSRNDDCFHSKWMNDESYFDYSNCPPDKEINGQLQGLKSLKHITVNGTLTTKNYFGIADYAFYGCENLQTAEFNTTVSFGGKAFSESNSLTDIYLLENKKSECKIDSDSTFYGLTEVGVHVNDNRYGTYTADSNWTSSAAAGQIILVNMSGTQQYTPDGQ